MVFEGRDSKFCLSEVNETRRSEPVMYRNQIKQIS